MIFRKAENMEIQEPVRYLEYIESTGTQRIDTGFQANQDTRVVMHFQLTSTTEEQTPFLARPRSEIDSFGIFHRSMGWDSDYGDSRQLFSGNISITDEINVDCNKNVTTMNGEIITHPVQTFSTSVNLILLARNTNGTINQYASAKLYSCQIYDNDTLIRDYWPAKDPDGAVCLYDKASKEYVYNDGTGNFTAGPEV